MLDYLNAEIEKRQNEIAKIEAERHKLDQRRHDLGIELRTMPIRARLAAAATNRRRKRDGNLRVQPWSAPRRQCQVRRVRSSLPIGK